MASSVVPSCRVWRYNGCADGAVGAPLGVHDTIPESRAWTRQKFRSEKQQNELNRSNQKPLNAPFLNGLFSSGFSRGKTAP